MRSFTKITLSLLVALCLVGFGGCNSGKTDVAKTDSSQDDDHDDDHEHGDDDDDHGDDHDHGDGDDHDDDADHKHPETYDQAVAQLVAMHETIKQGFAGDDTEAGHGPLHDVGHLLEDTENLVEKSDMSDDVKKSLTDAIDTLFGAYGAVDDKLHGEEGKEYSDVSEEIETSIKTLQAQVSEKAKQ